MLRMSYSDHFLSLVRPSICPLTLSNDNSSKSLKGFVTSLTNVAVYIQVYMQVYLHIYIHIYIQVAHNFDNFYATKLKLIFTQIKTLDFMVELPLGLALGFGQGSECIISHIEHMQNDNRIISLVPLIALES